MRTHLPRRLGFALAPIAITCAVACGSSGSTSEPGATAGGDGGTGETSVDGGGLSDASAGSDGAARPDGGAANDGAVAPSGPKPVFVIPMENKDDSEIYGDTTDAPDINGTLMKTYAYATSFTDELAHSLPSEPHYVWMESGTNVFSDGTFSTDSDPSSANSTSNTEHLATQLTTAGISWTSYQEGITAGTCPTKSVTAQFYAAKHDPFVFFQDITGEPPSASSATCAAHHKALSSLASDLSSGGVSTYNFITPNLCNDMHGDANCPQGTATAGNITAGDNWLKNNLPPIVTYALAHDGYVFIVWDEGDALGLMPFIAIGNHVIAAKNGTVVYNHSSLLKSEEEILGVPVNSRVTGANDFADLFASGTFP